MLCKKPYQVDSYRAVGCGQCLPCRINRRRVWAHRIMLESYAHGQNSFVTLTYSDDHLPNGGTLAPEDLKNWFKRIRKAVAPAKIRYFAVGEYGDETWRPHYHVALFGVARTAIATIRETWGKGHVDAQDLVPAAALYLSGYVTKKMTSKLDARLNGRYPEFSRMSLKPGIGAPSIEKLTRVLSTSSGRDSVVRAGDVPRSLVYAGKAMPLGRYLRDKLRESVGDVQEFKENSNQKHLAEMRELRQEARLKYGKEAFRILREEDIQKIKNLENRYEIFKQKKEIL